MKLPAAGVEYVTFTVSADFTLDGTIEVFIGTDDDYPAVDATWTAASWSGAETIGTDGDHVRAFQVLLAGSELVSPPVGSAQLVAGLNYVFVKLTDNPEIVIRRAGRIEGL
jgi:hypothetical protein